MGICSDSWGDDFIIVKDPTECLRLAREAATIESVAMQHDLAGEALDAMQAYREAVAKLREATEACPEGHPDNQVLLQHLNEVLARAQYLECLDSSPVTKPIEEHIHPCFLTLGSPALLPEQLVSRCSHEDLAKEAKIMGTAAAIGGATGLLTLGPLSGVALGVAVALATTREDQAGLAARQVGDAGVKLLCRARRLDKEHRISDSLLSAGHSLIRDTSKQARQVVGNICERQAVVEKMGRRLSSLGLALVEAAATSAA
jgi:hypothetical protein